MAKASTSNYDSAIDKYNKLVEQYSGAENYSKLYNQSASVASKNSQQVQQDKYNSYISQGMNPAQAARAASQDASDNYTTEKDSLTEKLYSANQDIVNQKGQTNLEHAKTKDDVSNQNKGRVLSTVGGVVSGVANAL